MLEDTPGETALATTPVARFGKYEVIGLLGRGGMAEVFLCRLGGLGGFNKEVVVKRMLPQYLDDPSFLQMFIEEARLAANLNHPNVVQVFEIDEANGIPYIAMEYVRGPTLATTISEARGQNNVQFGHIAKIVSGVCAGLHHAHFANGADGECLGIIHRDVSPQNILISPDGVPKILDFGIAKALGRSVATETGALKGKLRYMAPERFQQGHTDHRADVFSAGVVLFEATTGRGPFGAAKTANEYEMLRSLLNGEVVRPSEIVPGYPAELEKLVLWAIACDVEKRCPSAQHLHHALEAFVAKGEYASSTHDLAQWMNDIVPSRLFSLPKGRGMGSLANLTHSQEVLISGSGHTPQNELQSRFAPTNAQQGGFTPVTAATGTHTRKWKLAAALLVAALSALGVGLAMQRPASTPTTAASTAPVQSAGQDGAEFSPDEAARAYLDEVERLNEAKRYGVAEELLGKARALQIRDPGLNIRLLRLDDVLRVQLHLRDARNFLAQQNYTATIESAKNVLDRDPENAEAIQLIAKSREARDPQITAVARAARSPRRQRPGSLFVTSNVLGMVYLNDEPIGRTPIRDREIPAGEYSLQIRAQGHRPYEARIEVSAGKPFSLEAALTAEERPREDVVSSRPTPAESIPAVSAQAVQRAPELPAATLDATRPRTVAASQGAASSVNHGVPTTTSVGAAVAAPTAVAATTPKTKATDAAVSARPNSRVTLPTLPREYAAKDAADIERACRIIEKQVVSLAGVSPEFASGVTGTLQRSLGGKPSRLYPVAMYYLIVIEAGKGHDKKTASQALVAMHGDSALRTRMGSLPAREQKH